MIFDTHCHLNSEELYNRLDEVLENAKKVGVDKFLEMLKGEKNRKARIEHCFAYCEPGGEPIIFTGGGTGTIAKKPKGERGRWHDKFFIPDGEKKTLSELREIDYEKEASYWGTAKDDFAKYVGTDPVYISYIETGKRFPSIEYIEKMAETLKVESYKLFLPANIDINDISREILCDKLKEKIIVAINEVLQN